MLETYFDHVIGAASRVDFNKHKEDNPLQADDLLSTETINTSLIDFTTFAREYPEKLFPLLDRLRPEFRELFIEYHILRKSQSFLGKAHGCTQAYIWPILRMIGQTIGAFIILGPEPGALEMQAILTRLGLENTPYGSLTTMILQYEQLRNYRRVAQRASAPPTAIRKIFRPAIAKLLADKDIRTVALGAYIRNLTHQSSLTKSGFSKKGRSRLRRVQHRSFMAPSPESASLFSFGHTDALQDAPWWMLEVSSDGQMPQIIPQLFTGGKRAFGKKAAQIFAPTNANGELTYGYIFARAISPDLIHHLTRIRGISNVIARYDDNGKFENVIEVPNKDVQEMLKSYEVPTEAVQKDDFVQILTGPAAGYCGTVIKARSQKIQVLVTFPTGRQFTVTATPASVKLLPVTSTDQRNFWGLKTEIVAEASDQPVS